MTNARKNEIVDNIMSLLIQLTDDETTATTETVSKPLEILTVKEWTEAVKGLKENTVRSLVAQGKRGKILINKEDLLNYFA